MWKMLRTASNVCNTLNSQTGLRPWDQLSLGEFLDHFKIAIFINIVYQIRTCSELTLPYMASVSSEGPMVAVNFVAKGLPYPPVITQYISV